MFEMHWPIRLHIAVYLYAFRSYQEDSTTTKLVGTQSAVKHPDSWCFLMFPPSVCLSHAGQILICSCLWLVDAYPVSPHPPRLHNSCALWTRCLDPLFVRLLLSCPVQWYCWPADLRLRDGDQIRVVKQVYTASRYITATVVYAYVIMVSCGQIWHIYLRGEIALDRNWLKMLFESVFEARGLFLK